MSLSVPTLLCVLGTCCCSIQSVLSVVRRKEPYEGLAGGSLALLFATVLTVRVTEPPASWTPVIAGLAAVLVVLAYYGAWKAGIGDALRLGGASNGRRTGE